MTEAKKFADIALRLLGKEVQYLDAEEKSVLKSIAEHGLSSRDAADVAIDSATYGERLSDKVAKVGGSWGFIIAFSLVLIGWMLLNTDVLSRWGMAFDLYPYIFLNLMLSTVAAIQAPIIMMSQNRQEARDREHAEKDYQVNLKAELEIRHLHEKLDHLLRQHSERLLEIQQIQVDLLRQLVARSPAASAT